MSVVTKRDPDVEYKGETITYRELITRPTPMVIEAITPVAGIPKLGVIGSITKSTYTPTFTIYPYTGRYQWQTMVVSAPHESKVKVLTGSQGREIIEKFETHKQANIPQFATWGGTIGADPEMFVEKENGELLPAFEFLPSKQQVPHDRMAYWDGFQAEFNIPAGGCLMGFADYIRMGLQNLHKMACKHKARLTIDSVRQVDLEHLVTGKEEHVQWGCAPSNNLYNLVGLMRSGREVPVRFAGGHIHYGTQFNSEQQLKNTVNALDHILAVSCVSLFANIDNPIRREFYGLPGEYRVPAHGLEYRVLSNAWLMHPVMCHLVVDLSRRAFAWGYNDLNKYWKCENTEMIEVVRGCDVAGARKILTRNKDILQALIKTIPSYSNSEDVAYSIIFNGCEVAIKNPKDIFGNWQLNETYWNREYWTSAIPDLRKGLTI